MKSGTLLALTAGATFGIASLAVADQHDPSLDEVVEIPDFDLGPDGSTFEHTVNLDPDVPVVGFTFVGTWAPADGSPWASDTRLDIVPPGGEAFAVGGFGTGGADVDWDFDGSGSSSPGTYTSTHFPEEWDGGISQDGEWSFLFENTFGSETGHDWSDVSITLHKIPAPGALALLGLAGLAGSRRRRD